MSNEELQACLDEVRAEFAKLQRKPLTPERAELRRKLALDETRLLAEMQPGFKREELAA